jgi:hypothetical protein
MEIDTLLDPARFAKEIRWLALDAHRTLRHSPNSADLRRLRRRIELVSSALGERRGRPLETWLDSLGRAVQLAALEGAASYRPMCLCA